ncbi:MAG: METTL5 family protein [Thermoplasmata archaeon]
MLAEAGVAVMKKRQLEMVLQGLKPFTTRSPRLEQYATPADIAADVLWEAHGAGDIEGKTVADLGCGNGVFSIGARIMGASRVFAVDVDPQAVRVARENASALNLDIEFLVSSVESAEGRFDTVIQNPPFGAQTRHADRAFIKKSLELAPKVYSLHLEGTEGFVSRMVNRLGGASRPVKRFKFEIPYAFEFHRKKSKTFSVILLKFER